MNNKDSVTNTKQAGYLYTETNYHDGEQPGADGEQPGAINRDESRQGLWECSS